MQKLTLRFILLFSKLWTRMGIDVAQLRLIIETKLTIDDRSPLTSFGKNQDKKPSKYSTWFQFFIFMLMGAIFLSFVYTIPDKFLATSIFLTLILSMLSLSLITDFSPVLLDNKDQYIILPRPVNDKTLAFSRVLYMLIKISTQLLALSLPTIIYIAINWDIVPVIIFLIQLVLSSLIAVFFVNIFYSLCLRFLSIQKFKDLISYIQIFFSIFVFIGYQIGPRVMANVTEGTSSVHQLKLLWLSPGTWIASFQGLWLQDFSMMTISFSVLSILLLLVAISGSSQLFSKDFNSKIARLAAGDTPVERAENVNVDKIPFYKKIEKLVTSTPLEKAGFSIVWLITARSREFKMQLYPTLAYLPVYFLFLFSQGKKNSFAAKIDDLNTSGLYIMMFYLSLLTVLTVFQLVTKSDKYKAAWIYYAAPIGQTGELMSGVLKASFLKYFLPFNLIFLLICVPLFGIHVINDILLATAIGGVECVLITLFLVKAFPFSQAVQNGKSKVLVNLIVLGLLGLIGYLHIMLHQYEMAIWGTALLMWIVFFFLIKVLKKENWKSLDFETG
ncbi:hypothetical protein [Sphingobacterium yanglingense]|uniref:ABC-2 type transport system permease protein n=1 Tax=Sphingobacterium yanglingense TaxID=1437280 RepID=A0A4R6WIS0_9SPHI|nr:hypothetical protein [Sphingobacterium yanglingense]TDQ80054.1 hypothetical protein CLV99_1508 [Sphingobacterium yanglingense]